MNIKQAISKGIKKVENINASKTKAYKQRLKEQIRHNIQVKKQTPADNQVIIDRYYNAKPQPLTQMQEALQGAVQ